MVMLNIPYRGESIDEAARIAGIMAETRGDYGSVALSCTDESKSNDGLPRFFIEVGHPDYPQDTFEVTVVFYRKEGNVNKNIMWYIHFDHIENEVVNIKNCPDDKYLDKVKSGAKLRKFRLYNDDGEVDYTGEMVCSDGSDPMKSPEIFAPLDDYGMPNAGSTSLSVKGDGGWEVI